MAHVSVDGGEKLNSELVVMITGRAGPILYRARFHILAGVGVVSGVAPTLSRRRRGTPTATLDTAEVMSGHRPGRHDGSAATSRAGHTTYCNRHSSAATAPRQLHSSAGSHSTT